MNDSQVYKQIDTALAVTDILEKKIALAHGMIIFLDKQMADYKALTSEIKGYILDARLSCQPEESID